MKFKIKRSLIFIFALAIILLCLPVLADEPLETNPTGTDLLIVYPDVPKEFTLDAAVSWALEHNNALENLRLELEAARSGLSGAKLMYCPSLDFNGMTQAVGPASSMNLNLGGNPIDIQLTTNEFIETASVTLTQPVYTFGTIELAVESAELRLKQANFQYERMKETISRDVEKTFLNAALTEALLDVANGAVGTAEERLRIANVKFDNGTAAKFEVLRSEVALANRKEELIQAQTASDLTHSALAQKLGLPLGSDVSISPPSPDDIVPAPPSFTLLEAQLSAIGNRKDLKALETAIDLSGVNVGTKRNRPKLFLQGSYSYSDEPRQLSGDRVGWSVFLNFSYNLFDSGRSGKSVDQASASRDALKAQLEETRTLVALEVESAYHALSDAINNIEVSSATLESAREALRIAEIGYSEGVITYIDYQDADLGLRQADSFRLKAIYGYLIAQSALKASMGSE